MESGIRLQPLEKSKKIISLGVRLFRTLEYVKKRTIKNKKKNGLPCFFIEVAKFSNTSYISKNNLGLAISIFDIKRAHSATDSNKWVYTTLDTRLYSFLADRLTLYQPGGSDYAFLGVSPQFFGTLLQHCLLESLMACKSDTAGLLKT